MNLSNAELERLAILAEEAGEVQQIIGKIIRHGYESYNPFDEAKKSNRSLLVKEVGDLLFAIGLMTGMADLNQEDVFQACNEMLRSKGIYWILPFGS